MSMLGLRLPVMAICRFIATWFRKRERFALAFCHAPCATRESWTMARWYTALKGICHSIGRSPTTISSVMANSLTTLDLSDCSITPPG